MFRPAKRWSIGGCLALPVAVACALVLQAASFGATASPPVIVRPVGIAAVDLNGDGILDLATANFASGNASVLVGRGDGSSGPPSTTRIR
jgi:hypothetical protein